MRLFKLIKRHGELEEGCPAGSTWLGRGHFENRTRVLDKVVQSACTTLKR
jgi:hypothetical protein